MQWQERRVSLQEGFRQNPIELPENLPAILHLGCGNNKYPGAFGVDRVNTPVVDLAWDLNRRPWPLPENAFSKVYMIDVLEHLDDVIATMDEVYRVCRPDAEVVIIAPFVSSHHLWTDPTHKRGFTSRSFKYFTDEFASAHFEYSKSRFRVVEAEYDKYEDWIWLYRPKWFERQMLKFINQRKALYERRFMYWYPVQNIYFRLQVVGK
jgi:SAM-dependent methyltransferase